MKKISAKQIEQFVAACHKAADYGLVKCSSGNFSWRADEDVMLVSATKSWIPDITPEQVSLCRISDGKILNSCQPSIESGFHAGIFKNRPDVNVVLHFQSPAATTIACCDPPTVDFNVILEVPFYVGPVAAVPFLNPGSQELANAVVSAAKTHDMVMLQNHGQVVVGRDFDDTIQKAVFFELACDIILRAGNSHSLKISPISPAAVAHLRSLATKPQASA